MATTVVTHPVTMPAIVAPDKPPLVANGEAIGCTAVGSLLLEEEGEDGEPESKATDDWLDTVLVVDGNVDEAVTVG